MVTRYSGISNDAMEVGKCWGCDILDDNCIIRRAQEQDKCPCCDCLLKNMCSLSCDEWKNIERYSVDKIGTRI